MPEIRPQMSPPQQTRRGRKPAFLQPLAQNEGRLLFQALAAGWQKICLFALYFQSSPLTVASPPDGESRPSRACALFSGLKFQYASIPASQQVDHVRSMPNLERRCMQAPLVAPPASSALHSRPKCHGKLAISAGEVSSRGAGEKTGRRLLKACGVVASQSCPPSYR